MVVSPIYRKLVAIGNVDVSAIRRQIDLYADEEYDKQEMFRIALSDAQYEHPSNVFDMERDYIADLEQRSLN